MRHVLFKLDDGISGWAKHFATFGYQNLFFVTLIHRNKHRLAQITKTKTKMTFFAVGLHDWLSNDGGMFGAHVQQQGVASRIHRRTEWTWVLSGKVYIVMVSGIAHYFTAQDASSSFIHRANSFKQLGHFVTLYIWNKDRTVDLHCFAR